MPLFNLSVSFQGLEGWGTTDRELWAVMASARAHDSCTSSGSKSVRPSIRICTPWRSSKALQGQSQLKERLGRSRRRAHPFSQISTSLTRAMSIKASTSCGSRLKFSMEKAYTVT